MDQLFQWNASAGISFDFMPRNEFIIINSDELRYGWRFLRPETNSLNTMIKNYVRVTFYLIKWNGLLYAIHQTRYKLHSAGQPIWPWRLTFRLECQHEDRTFSGKERFSGLFSMEQQVSKLLELNWMGTMDNILIQLRNLWALKKKVCVIAVNPSNIIIFYSF